MVTTPTTLPKAPEDLLNAPSTMEHLPNVPSPNPDAPSERTDDERSGRADSSYRGIHRLQLQHAVWLEKSLARMRTEVARAAERKDENISLSDSARPWLL